MKPTSTPRAPTTPPPQGLQDFHFLIFVYRLDYIIYVNCSSLVLITEQWSMSTKCCLARPVHYWLRFVFPRFREHDLTGHMEFDNEFGILFNITHLVATDLTFTPRTPSIMRNTNATKTTENTFDSATSFHWLEVVWNEMVPRFDSSNPTISTAWTNERAN